MASDCPRQGEVELGQFWKLSPLGERGTLLNVDVLAKINMCYY